MTAAESIGRTYQKETAFETWIAYFGNTESGLICVVGATPEEARDRLIGRLREFDGLGAAFDVDAWEKLLNSEPAVSWTQMDARLDPDGADTFRIVADHKFTPPPTVQAAATGATGTLHVTGHREPVEAKVIAWCERDAAAQGIALPDNWGELDAQGKQSAYFATDAYGANLRVQ